MRRFLVIAFLSFAMASASYASLISTATVNILNGCGASSAVMGTSSASTTACTASLGGSASTSINFGITASTIASWTFNDVAAPQTSALSTSLFDNEFVVTGGSGAGFLTLTFAESGAFGHNDPQASDSFNVLASLNGTQYSDVRICGNLPATSTFVCANPTDSIGVAFTYGTPFELSVELDAVAGGGLGGSGISGGGTLSYSLPSQSAVLSTPVPEPVSAIMTMTGMFAMLLRRRITT